MKKHTRRPRSEYQALLDRKHSEQLTYAELSEASGVPEATLHYWARKLRDEAPGASPASHSDAFLRVSLAAPLAPAIEVVVTNDVRIAVRPGFDPATLRAVIDALAC